MILLKSLAIFFSYMLFPNSPFYDTYFTSKTLFIKPFSLLKVSSKVTCKKCQLSIFSPSPDLSHSVPQAQASHSKQHQSQFIPFTQQCHCFVTPEIPPQNPWFLRARDGLSLAVARRAEYCDHSHSLVEYFHIKLDLFLWLMSPQAIRLICAWLFLTSRF